MWSSGSVKKKNVNSLELKVSSTTKINRNKEGSGFNESSLTRQFTSVFTVVKSLGNYWGYGFKHILQVVTNSFVHRADAHSGGQFNCYSTGANASFKKI